MFLGVIIPCLGTNFWQTGMAPLTSPVLLMKTRFLLRKSWGLSVKSSYHPIFKFLLPAYRLIYWRDYLKSQFLGGLFRPLHGSQYLYIYIYIHAHIYIYTSLHIYLPCKNKRLIRTYTISIYLYHIYMMCSFNHGKTMKSWIKNLLYLSNRVPPFLWSLSCLALIRQRTGFWQPSYLLLCDHRCQRARVRAAGGVRCNAWASSFWRVEPEEVQYGFYTIVMHTFMNNMIYI